MWGFPIRVFVMYPSSLIQRFSRDKQGTVALMFGLSIFILLAMVGLAIDASRLFNVRANITEGLDAAALASAKMFDKEDATPEEFQQAAQSYLTAHMKRSHIGDVKWGNLRTEINQGAGSVKVTADVSVKTLFGNISANIGTVDFSPSATVIYKARKIEIAMVVDITGSMCDRVPSRPSDACYDGQKIGGLKDAAAAMVDAMAATAPAPGAIRISIVPYSASVNAGDYAATVSGGNSTDGCVVERNGAAAYTAAAPDGSNALGTSSTAQNPSYSCPRASVLPLTDVVDAAGRERLKDKIDTLAGYGGTAGHLGAAWGWYTLSPDWSSIWPSDSTPRNYNEAIKVVILMTDGMFNTSYRNGGDGLRWPASADSTHPGSSGYQALRICENLRQIGNNVVLYTVGYQTPPEAEALLKQCSGEAYFMSAQSADALIEHYKKIAGKLSAMRISG